MSVKIESVVDRYVCSTSRFGTGNRENSLKTPLGIHRIKEKFGGGAPAGRIFRDREDTGMDWDHSQTGDNLILTRILRLEGLEEGINKGPGRSIRTSGTSTFTARAVRT